MKSSESKTTTSSHLPPAQKASQPFFRKDGEGSFFSKEAPQTEFFFNKNPIQAKLSIGAPGDKYEQEADAMAEKVVQRLSTGSAVQAKCAECPAEEGIQKMEGKEEVEETGLEVQQKAIFESNEEQPAAEVQAKPDAAPAVQAKCAACEEEDKLQKKEEEDLSENELENGASSGSAPVEQGDAPVINEPIAQEPPTQGAGNEGAGASPRSGGSASCPRSTKERTELKLHGDQAQRPESLECPFDSEFSSNDGEFNFLQGSSDVSRIAAVLDSFKKRWNSTGGDSYVVLHGFASVEGCEGFNWALSCRRAINVRNALMQPCLDGSPGIPDTFIEIFGQGETNQFSMSSLSSNRVVKISSEIPIAPEPGRSRTETDLKVTVKSFIAPIGFRIGSLPARCLALDLIDPTRGIGSSGNRLQALAIATDLMMSENPLSDAKDDGYRMYSSKTFRATCDGDRILSVVPSPLDTDVGMEGPLEPPALSVLHDFSSPPGSPSFSFAWTVKGRPNLGAEPGFQLVCPRTSVFIWHSVSGEITCSGGMPTVSSLSLVDSRFPSDRVFVDGAIRETHAQEGYARLWYSSPTDVTLVE